MWWLLLRTAMRCVSDQSAKLHHKPCYKSCWHDRICKKKQECNGNEGRLKGFSKERSSRMMAFTFILEKKNPSIMLWEQADLLPPNYICLSLGLCSLGLITVSACLYLTLVSEKERSHSHLTLEHSIREPSVQIFFVCFWVFCTVDAQI